MSEAILDLDEKNHTLDIRGTPEEIKRGEEYVFFVLDQRTGNVDCDLSIRRPDLTVVNVPEDVVGMYQYIPVYIVQYHYILFGHFALGFVMGRSGSILRDMEDASGTLMFFSKGNSKVRTHDKVEKLAIFGRYVDVLFYLSIIVSPLHLKCFINSREARRAAELKVMSKVEQKHPNWFLDGTTLREPFNAPGDYDVDSPEFDNWGTESFPLHKEDFSYALGIISSSCNIEWRLKGCLLTV